MNKFVEPLLSNCFACDGDQLDIQWYPGSRTIASIRCMNMECNIQLCKGAGGNVDLEELWNKIYEQRNK